MRWLGRGKFRLLRSQRGFSLIEVVVAVAILAAIGVVFLSAMTTNTRASGVLDEKVQATNLVTAYLENMRQLPYSDTTNPYPTISSNVTIPTQYSVAVDITYSPNGNDWYSTNASGTYKLQRISISVARTGGKLVLTTCTFRANR